MCICIQMKVDLIECMCKYKLSKFAYASMHIFVNVHSFRCLDALS
jgi:hypothetical protein